MKIQKDRVPMKALPALIVILSLASSRAIALPNPWGNAAMFLAANNKGNSGSPGSTPSNGNTSQPGGQNNPNSAQSAAPELPDQNTHPRDQDIPSSNVPQNTGVNGANLSDQEIGRQVQNAIRSDDSLLDAAKNIKITAGNGKVILQGSVHAARDRRQIAARAAQIVGAKNVINYIIVK